MHVARIMVGWIASTALAVALVGCCGGDKKEDKTSRWEAPAKSSQPAATDKAKDNPSSSAAASSKPLEGSAFNKFFPADGVDGAKRTFSQEKQGYAEAKFQKDGKELAVLSISDTTTNPEARTKFDGATEKLQGYPLMTVGKNQSTILVKSRFQVKASSQTLDAEARKTWIAKFDLNGLAGL